ncbi:signal transduction superfamily protein with modified HD-GYP domain [Neiella marina]|uniref:Signal transduction superfamily protein with modified HD-GYP domain n=1 Tax=Neiella marina TaxID=508461 RepID=A0A8J2XNK5_9GAMM|nr:HDOD domain-containing protein [Neiella marina]GGA69344.1 signal transduction superfamily protein with modified HD-GYP domain [Neiella marina]
MAIEQALVLTFKDKLARDVLVIPSLPKVAMSVCETVEREDVSLKEIAELITRDAGMAARMIKISNSPLFGVSQRIKTIHDAVNRIGLTAIKNIATTMAMEQLYVSTNERIFELLEENWKRAVRVASSAAALATMYPKRLPFNSELITLAGVVHNIGALPILLEMERMPQVSADMEVIHRVVHSLQHEMGTKLLAVWEFDDTVIDAVKQLQQPRPAKGEASLGDFICAAAIAQGTYQLEDEKQLLKPFIDKGIVADLDVFTSPEYLTPYRDTLSSFN